MPYSVFYVDFSGILRGIVAGADNLNIWETRRFLSSFAAWGASSVKYCDVYERKFLSRCTRNNFTEFFIKILVVVYCLVKNVYKTL